MVKRHWAGREEQDAPQSKRTRTCSTDRLSSLSDELVLRTLSFLPVTDLALCQRLSRRFHTLSGDSQLWKSVYYNRFVRPRASRIPGIRDHSMSSGSLFYSSHISRWLEDERLVKKGREMDWKKQYKLRHNWSRGSCDVSEIQIAERPSLPPMLVRLHEDIVITADKTYGLRAWTMKGSQRLLATLIPFLEKEREKVWETPTSIAIDTANSKPDRLSISIGFTDGSFGVFILKKAEDVLCCQYMHAASSNGMISAIAYATPYLVTMTDAQLLSLYSFPIRSVAANNIEDPPSLLASLKSYTAWPPLTLSIRTFTSCIVISVAYAIPNHLSGWSVGLQELRMTTEGTMIRSRLTSAGNQGFHPLFASISGSSTPPSDVETATSRQLEFGSLPSMTKPTSLSYSHPYLLASHPDNTLTLYLVQSNDRDLIIGSGSRLWGHTSSVSGAHVGDRGKAVSVSAHGGEIRIWELEGGVTTPSSRKRADAGQVSVQIRPDRNASTSGSSGIPQHGENYPRQAPFGVSVDDFSTTKGWVGFDEEKVVVLREKGLGSQALVVFDFS